MLLQFVLNATPQGKLGFSENGKKKRKKEMSKFLSAFFEFKPLQ